MPARRRYRTMDAVSAGGVVYRGRNAALEVVLLETVDGRWGLPKGTPDPGETLEQTAVREVQEETGLQVTREEKVGTIEYWFVRATAGERYHKFVHFWLMHPNGGSLDHHDHEHRAARWFPYAEALTQVAHDNSRDILRRTAALLRRREAGAAPAGPAREEGPE